MAPSGNEAANGHDSEVDLADGAEERPETQQQPSSSEPPVTSTTESPLWYAL